MNSDSTSSDDTESSADPNAEGSGLGQISLQVPEGTDIPDAGTITLKFTKSTADEAEPPDPSGMVELDITSIEDVQPVASTAPTKMSPADAFEQTAKSVRGAS